MQGFVLGLGLNITLTFTLHWHRPLHLVTELMAMTAAQVIVVAFGSLETISPLQKALVDMELDHTVVQSI